MHFGFIVTINLGIGQQTPPVASVLMVACSIAKASVWEVTRVNVWFIGVLLAVLLLVTYVPVSGWGWSIVLSARSWSGLPRVRVHAVIERFRRTRPRRRCRSPACACST